MEKIKILLFIMLFFVLGASAQYPQKLPKKLLDGLSSAMISLAPSEKLAVDQFTVAVLISPRGDVDRVYFSIGTPEKLKSVIRSRLAIATSSDLIPLSQYWKQIAEVYKIQTSTCIIQPVFVRFSNSNSQRILMDGVAEKFTSALTFEDSSFLFQKDISLIWLNPRNYTAKAEQIVN